MINRVRQILQESALRHRSFRLLWVTSLCSSTARWADLVVVGWLTLELTDSPLMVGVVAACKMAGLLFSPAMGVAADRIDRRRLLIVASLLSWSMALITLLLLLTGWMTIEYLIALSLVSSLAWALDNPTRQAFISDLVEGRDLTNAIALNSVATEMTVVIGPALGGLLIPMLGMGGAYALIVTLYVLDLTLLGRLKSVKPVTPRARESALKSLIDGFSYVRENQPVLVLLVIAFLLNLLVAPYRYSFLPLFARYVLNVSAAGYGFLTSMAGVGALVAGLWVVAQTNLNKRGRLVALGSVLWPTSLLLFSLSNSYYLSLFLVLFAGLAQAISWTMIATLILSNTSPAMRGRVMGLRTGVVISLPFGNFFAGAAAEQFGVSGALSLYSIFAMILMLSIILLVPKLRHLQ